MKHTFHYGAIILFWGEIYFHKSDRGRRRKKQIFFSFKLATHSTASNSGKKHTNEISKIEF